MDKNSININNSFDFNGMSVADFENHQHKVVEYGRIIDPSYKPLRYLSGCFDNFFRLRPQPTPLYADHVKIIGRCGERVTKDNVLYVNGCTFSKADDVQKNIIPMLEEGVFNSFSTRTPFIHLVENKKDNCIDVVEATLRHISLVDFPADEGAYLDNDFNIDDFIRENKNIIQPDKRVTRVYFNI